jgi:hypothetical protein
MCLMCGCDRCIRLQPSSRDQIRLCLSFCSDSQDSRRTCIPLDTGPQTVNVHVLYDVVRHGVPPSLRLDIGPAREHAQSAVRVSLSQCHCLSAYAHVECNKLRFSNGEFYHVKLPVRARIRKLGTALAPLVCLHLCIPMSKSCTSKFIQHQNIVSPSIRSSINETLEKYMHMLLWQLRLHAMLQP